MKAHIKITDLNDRQWRIAQELGTAEQNWPAQVSMTLEGSLYAEVNLALTWAETGGVLQSLLKAGQR